MNVHIQNSKERRKHRRFKSQGKTFALFRAPHPSLGQIIDISEGGLSILYIEGDEEPTKVVEFDLFSLNDDVKVRSIAAVARSDQQLPSQKASKTETARRRGIEFIGLMGGQKEAVREFILKQTAGNGGGD